MTRCATKDLSFSECRDVLRRVPRALNASFDFDELQVRILGFAFELIPRVSRRDSLNGPDVGP
jgi:hypothetical protein